VVFTFFSPEPFNPYRCFMSDIITTSDGGDGTVFLKLNDAARQNRFADDFIDRFIAALESIEAKGGTKVLVIHGLPEVFCAGADKKNLLALCDGTVHVKDLAVSRRLLDLPFPVIAAMEGHAVGGGLMVAVCCDMVIAAKESRYGASFMELGFTPGMGCTQLLEQLVGPYVAAEMMFTARLFKGSELAGKGVNINAIVPKSDVMKSAADMAKRVAEKNRESLYLLKYTLASRRKKMLIDAQAHEDLMHRISFGFPQTRTKIEELYKEQP
jgi:polyketide biosynthesis enoyl-CoA hydratase PksI